MAQSHGPVILDLLGTELSKEEAEILQHPLVGGVIFFARNYHSPEQIIQLCKQIRKVRKSSPILISVDHEGGRVQRFRDGFTRIPSMGQIYSDDLESAAQLAESCGWLMASELLAVGIDLSFAPVLDLDRGINPAIGDRAFHVDPVIVTTLASSVMQGMKKAGMAATGKHFPGHGSVCLDSHKGIPIDQRSFEKISAEDMQPFVTLVQSGIQAIMPAHIIFSEVDDKPVGFSKIWLQDILRERLKFSGVIFSDDLNMEGAGFAGDYIDRAQAALTAGCDMVLICNNRAGAVQILDRLPQTYSVSDEKFKSLCGQFTFDHNSLKQSRMWKEYNEFIIKRVDYEYTK